MIAIVIMIVLIAALCFYAGYTAGSMKRNV